MLFLTSTQSRTLWNREKAMWSVFRRWVHETTLAVAWRATPLYETFPGARVQQAFDQIRLEDGRRQHKLEVTGRGWKKPGVPGLRRRRASKHCATGLGLPDKDRSQRLPPQSSRHLAPLPKTAWAKLACCTM